tara:strand:+ start:4482 stop:4703 length:222 start_codon:yes stop_codon:yes gene_type:complete
MSTATITTYYCQFCEMVASFFSNRVEAYRQKRIVNDGIAQLNRMSDIELKDIGLTRGDIPAISRGEYVRPSSW